MEMLMGTAASWQHSNSCTGWRQKSSYASNDAWAYIAADAVNRRQAGNSDICTGWQQKSTYASAEAWAHIAADAGNRRWCD